MSEGVKGLLSDGAGTAADDDEALSGGLDCTLLESLFFQEMMKMDDYLVPITLQQQPSLFLPSSDAYATANPLAQIATADNVGHDPLTAAEFSLLNDFGVAEPAASSNAAFGGASEPQYAGSMAASVNTGAPAPTFSYASASASGTFTGGGSLITQRLAASGEVPVSYAPAPLQQQMDMHPLQAPVTQGLVQAAYSATAVSAAVPQADDKQRAKLLAQFTTLAARLGIALPPQALRTLASTGAAPGQPNATDAGPSREGDSGSSSHNHDGSKKRTREAAAATDSVSFDDSDTPDGGADGTSGTTASSAVGAKRRRKPRLGECDARLASLQEEHAVLQSRWHALQDQTRQSHQDRQEQEAKLAALLARRDADPREVQALIDHYQELYSDYGRRRHMELKWHLQQLSRLANPTNVTKMGLWTLGQGPVPATNGADRRPLSEATDAGDGSPEPSASEDGSGSSVSASSPSHRRVTGASTNPIVGLLQKELGITPQQSRKILEQRAKIRTVCGNLRECIALLAKLKTLCEQKTRIFHDRLSRCREILTPEQVLKLLVWIHEHNETVAHVCPGWGSEGLPLSKG